MNDGDIDMMKSFLSDFVHKIDHNVMKVTV